MKQSPELMAVQARMCAGLISRDGFLGDDARTLAEIIDADRNELNRLGLTAAELADRLDYFAAAGGKGLGTTVTVDGVCDVRVESVRGMLPCPWAHKGLYPKTNVYLKNLATGDEIIYSALQVHMIREHGFLEGRGSPFRIEPAVARRALGLHPAEEDEA